MGPYESIHPGVKEMQGLHLLHFFLSNCSQRARLGLESRRRASNGRATT